MQNDALQRAINARRLPGHAPIAFRAMSACDCGCDLPDRFEFSIGRMTICISDVKQIDALIAKMIEGREKLWGPKP